jgi:hypothetical protein
VTAPPAGHVTTLEGPDSAGHWAGRCLAGECPFDESGYEPGEVVERITRHGPLAADSPVPPDEEGDEFEDEANVALVVLVMAMAGRAKDAIAELHAAAVADLRRVGHMLREGSAVLPDGPWFTWLYDGTQTEDVEPEWAIRAGHFGQHVIVRARTSHITALGYLSLFPPQFARSLANNLERTADRAEAAGYTWQPGDIAFVQLARTYLEGLTR